MPASSTSHVVLGFDRKAIRAHAADRHRGWSFWGAMSAVLRQWRAKDESLRALAALDDDDLCHLSETGQKLRRSALQEMPTTHHQTAFGQIRRTAMTMKIFARSTGVCVAALMATVFLGGAERARGAELRLLSAAAMQTIFNEIAGDFERTSGHTLTITYRTMGDITERVLRGEGETADLVIGSSQSIARLVKEGKIDANSQMTIARVGIGAVVPTGMPKPPIGSVDEFKRALLAAKTVVYADPAGGGAAGIHVARVIEKLGLAEQLKPKTKFGAGGDITEVTLAQGEGALGLTQISEIVDKRGAEFVGPLPGELQNYTGVTAGIPAGAEPSEAVTAFIAFLQTPVAVATMERKGM